jgi:hypothetical protein
MDRDKCTVTSMHLLLALLLATRVGGMGMTVEPPDGWRVATPQELPTMPPFARVVALRSERASISIGRFGIPASARGKDIVAIARAIAFLADGDAARELTIGGAPAIELPRRPRTPHVRSFLAAHGESAYHIAAAGADDAVLDALFRSAEFSDAPIRIDGGGLSLLMPPNWQVATPHDAVVAAIKHTIPNGRIAAMVEVSRFPMSDAERHAGSVALARAFARGAIARFRADYDEEIQETTVAGVPAAAWGMRSTLIAPDRTRVDVRIRYVLIARDAEYYTIGYVGPADAPEAAAFDEIVKSIQFTQR